MVIKRRRTLDSPFDWSAFDPLIKSNYFNTPDSGHPVAQREFPWAAHLQHISEESFKQLPLD